MGSDINYPEVDLTVAQTGYPNYSARSIFPRYMQLGLIQVTSRSILLFVKQWNSS